MFFGAHVSIAGGIINAPKNAAAIGCEVFQMFTRSPQGGFVAPITAKIATDFIASCREYGQQEWVVHTPYFINFASATPRIYHSSITVIRDELERASQLKAHYLMTHLGSFKDLGKEKGFPQLIAGLKETLKGYKGSTQFLIEISAGAGAVIGSTFEEMGEIIHHPDLKKYDIGVCYDTAHGFASGYDTRTPETTTAAFAHFDAKVGIEKLKMFHCNDSKVELGAHKDRHEHIGKGHIGLVGFEAILAQFKKSKANFYLETEHDEVEIDLQKLKDMRKKLV